MPMFTHSFTNNHLQWAY